MKTYTTVKIESVDCDNLADDRLGEEKSARFRDELLACRVCLATDVKLFRLQENGLAEVFKEVTGSQVSPTDGLPQHVCVMCSSLLQKSATFRARCRKTLHYLQEILLKNPIITTEFLHNLDRTSFKLPLSVTKLETTSFKLPLSVNKPVTNEYLIKSDSENDTVEVRTTRKRKCKEKHLNNKLKDVIKEEIFVESTSADDNYDPESIADFDNDNATVDEYLATDFLTTLQACDNIDTEIKTEDVLDSTEDYSLRNAKKKKNKAADATQKVKKKKSRTKKVKDECGNVNIEDFEADVEVPKKKRMYNRKSEEDFECFAKMYNVEVVFLTQEQQMAELQARKESEEYTSARFQCDECYKSFMKESAFTKHMAWHDPSSGSHVCDICKVRFPVRHKLMKHLRRHRMHFICKFCKTISKESTMAKLHYKWHEGFKYECQHCGKNFNKPSSYMNHVRENHSALTCELCGHAAEGTRALAQHKATAHSGTFKCSSCDAQFHTEEALNRHLGDIAGHGCDPSVRPCAQCGAGFLAAQLLLEHMSQAHNDKIFRCEKCNTTYSNDRQLGIHWSRAHKGQKRAGDAGGGAGAGDTDYICEVCANSYSSETTLRYHQRIHTGEKPFQCPMCPKRFRMKTNLQVHINTHTGARPYKCALCPETFKSYSQKHKHRLLVHTKERRHKCHMCDKTYVVSFDLKMHIRTAHMKIPLPPRNRRRNQPVVSPLLGHGSVPMSREG